MSITIKNIFSSLALLVVLTSFNQALALSQSTCYIVCTDCKANWQNASVPLVCVESFGNPVWILSSERTFQPISDACTKDTLYYAASAGHIPMQGQKLSVKICEPLPAFKKAFSIDKACWRYGWVPQTCSPKECPAPEDTTTSKCKVHR